MQSKKKGEKPSQRQILVPVVKKPKERSNFKELAAENLIQEKGLGLSAVARLELATLEHIAAFLW